MASRWDLRLVLDDLFDYALRTFSADDVVRFLGYKVQPYKAEVESSHKRFSDLGETTRELRRRPDCRRIKCSVLLVETVINRPHGIRTPCVEKTRRGSKRYCYVAMTKSLHLAHHRRP